MQFHFRGNGAPHHAFSAAGGMVKGIFFELGKHFHRQRVAVGGHVEMIDIENIFVANYIAPAVVIGTPVGIVNRLGNRRGANKICHSKKSQRQQRK